MIPGFGVTLGITVSYLGLMVLLPLSALVLTLFEEDDRDVWQLVSEPSVIAAFKLSLTASFGAALVNAGLGFLVAWVLTRYAFPGRRLLDGIVDLPFALPTAVAGISLTTLFASNGWFGSLLEPLGIRLAFTPWGVALALLFVGMPFVVRTVQPVLEDLATEVEEASLTLGASRFQTFRRVILPNVVPALLTGFGLAFARGLGEYGSVVFISGNLPMKTEIVPLKIMSKLEQFDYRGAAAIAVGMLTVSFIVMLLINVVQGRVARRLGQGSMP